MKRIGCHSSLADCRQGRRAVICQASTLRCRERSSTRTQSIQRLNRRCPFLVAQRHQLQSRSVRRKPICVRAMMEPEGELVPEVDAGTKIKVTKEVTVYHAPKIPELQLQGKEGVVKQIVKKFKDKELSANLPYRVEFILDPDSEKPKKLLVHLDASEFEAVS